MTTERFTNENTEGAYTAEQLAELNRRFCGEAAISCGDAGVDIGDHQDDRGVKALLERVAERVLESFDDEVAIEAAIRATRFEMIRVFLLLYRRQESLTWNLSWTREERGHWHMEARFYSDLNSDLSKAYNRMRDAA